MSASRMTRIIIALSLLSGMALADDMPVDRQLSVLKALASAKIDFTQAVQKSLADQPAGAKAVEVKLVMKADGPIYKIEVLAGDELKEIDLDAITGKVLKVAAESTEDKRASEAAKATARAKLTLAEAVKAATKEYKGMPFKAEFEAEGGTIICEVQLVVDHEFLEVEVDAMTGKVLESEKEPAQAALWTFDHNKIGCVPDRWRVAETNSSGKLAAWKVETDPDGVKRGRVLALTETANEDQPFNLAIADGPMFKDLDLDVRVRATAGQEDQGGGPIWRCKDENNYYVCRFNPLETNFRVYYVKDGKRKQLKSEKVETEAGRWYTVRVRMVGSKIECYLDGRKLLEAEDNTFPNAGRIGLWTKADAATMFDDLAVKALHDQQPQPPTSTNATR